MNKTHIELLTLYKRGIWIEKNEAKGLKKHEVSTFST